MCTPASRHRLLSRTRSGDNRSPRCRSQQAHERLLAAIGAGDAGRGAGAFAPSARIAVRDPTGGPSAVLNGAGPDAVRQRFRLMIDVVADREVALLNRVIGDWYVFAEWIVRGRAVPGQLSGFAGGEAVEMRYASVFPITTDWRLAGEQGYCVVRGPMR